MKRITVLGSTGSIGTQALEQIRHLGYAVEAITAGQNWRLAEAQARQHAPRVVAMANEAAAAALREALQDTQVQVWGGTQAVAEAATLPCDLVLSAIVGIAGLAPTVAALQSSHPVALANKEALVAAGAWVTQLARQHAVPLLPVDSEHSAVFQCLQGTNQPPAGVILTASGGPFYGYTRAELQAVTPQAALQHPTWRMGNKITVDSATLMNKGFEVLEAAWLFGLPLEAIEVWVHPQSLVHALVRMPDGALLAQLGPPNMRQPIQYALTYPQRQAMPGEALQLGGKALTFAPPDETTFGALAICRRAFAMGGLAGAVLCGANDAANEAFLQQKLPFCSIWELAEAALQQVPAGTAQSLEAVLAAEAQGRAFVQGSLAARANDEK